MNIVDLQRRRPGPRADELLERLQAAVCIADPVLWNDHGHARVEMGREQDVRGAVAAHLDAIGADWPDHIAIL